MTIPYRSFGSSFIFGRGPRCDLSVAFRSISLWALHLPHPESLPSLYLLVSFCVLLYFWGVDCV